MLKHVVGVHNGQDMADVQFGMRILKNCQTSFDRQIRESVVIQSERQEHFLMNSRSEYNRCSLPRLCTSVGEGQYKDYSKELEAEKQEDEKLETRIRMLRKERNKARLHPTREPDNNKKRRKLEDGNYIKIQEIWGQPKQAWPSKNKNVEQENTQNKKPRKADPRPARGSPSPSKSPKIEKNHEEPELRSYDGPVDWDKKIDEHRKEIEQEQSKAIEAQEKQEQERESCWELQSLCREFLEENSKDWARIKEKRINEKNRVLRLEQAGILSRKAKIKALEKNIEIGLSKIPTKDREKLRQEKARKEEAELKAAKEDLWSLRGREKKIVENETSKKIKELKRTTEQIVEILHRERARKQQEKERKEKEEKIRANRKEQKRLREKKIKELQEKWAMYRWINEYIAENKQEWERTRKIREKERNEKILDWEKKSRHEKIKTLREKFWKRQEEKKLIQTEKKTPEKKQQEHTNWREKTNQDSSPPHSSPPSHAQNPS